MTARERRLTDVEDRLGARDDAEPLVLVHEEVCQQTECGDIAVLSEEWFVVSSRGFRRLTADEVREVQQ